MRKVYKKYPAILLSTVTEGIVHKSPYVDDFTCAANTVLLTLTMFFFCVANGCKGTFHVMTLSE